MLPEKNNSVRQWPEAQQKSLSGEKHSMKLEEIEEVGPLHKRWKSSSSHATNQWSLDGNVFQAPLSQYNPLNEPSPLGLRLKKSPSLLDLIEMRLSQCNGASQSENLQVENKRDVKARAGASGSIDKLKASNFPASLLKIGKWEYVSKHEGDLVAKCYFAKQKLVWEVLDGGLKNKIEIQWADIVYLKGNCPDNGPGILNIVLGKQPRFFRETNPQPRKHTMWQATSDFTNGEASSNMQHILQCAQGVLNKHYEKLVQCDMRLNFLSQQLDPVFDLPFAAEASIKGPGILSNSGSNESKISKDTSKEDQYTSSATSTKAFEEHVIGKNTNLQGPNNTEQLKAPGLARTMSISDLVNHIGHCISEQKSSGNLPFFESVSSGENPKEMLDNIAQILLSDTQLTTTSDEKTLMSRVNSLCSLLQDSNGGKNLMNQHDGNDDSNPGRKLIMPKNEMKEEENTGNEDCGVKQGSGMSRKDSFAELLHQLPRIASLPRFLFDISEDGEILNR